MKNTKTRRMVMIAILAALGMILNLIEIPYPIAPWLNFDLSEIVVLVATNTMGLGATLFVCLAKAIISVCIKGPVGAFAIGQITSFFASMSIAVAYYYLSKVIKLKNKAFNYALTMLFTMMIFAFVMFILNYLFVTPTYLTSKLTWYTQLPFAVDVNVFNGYYGVNLSVPSFLSWMSPYMAAIFIIYYPFNFLKGILTAVVYSFVKPFEKKVSAAGKLEKVD